jgi:hypothetical protein
VSTHLSLRDLLIRFEETTASRPVPCLIVALGAAETDPAARSTAASNRPMQDADV